MDQTSQQKTPVYSYFSLHTLSIFLLLSILWLGNSGHYTLLILAFGLFSILLVIWLTHRMEIIDAESQPFHLSRRLPGYYFWLLVQIVKSNIDVVGCILRGNKSISPSVVKLPCDLKTELGQVIYANSITLTPGTISMDLDKDSILVHALTTAGRDDLAEGEMYRRVAALEGES